MGQIFSGSAAQKAPKVSDHDRAVLELKVQRDRLKQYQKKMKSIVDKEVAVAQQHLAQGDKKRALLALRKKKYQEQLLDKSDAQLMNLEQMVNSIEYAVVEKQVLDGLKHGNSVLQQLNDQMKVEDVEKLMGETADAIAYQKEVEELLAGQISTEDEELVLKELEALEQEAIQEQVQLPDVPTTQLPQTDVAKQPAKATKAPSNKTPDLVAA